MLGEICVERGDISEKDVDEIRLDFILVYMAVTEHCYIILTRSFARSRVGHGQGTQIYGGEEWKEEVRFFFNERCILRLYMLCC